MTDFNNVAASFDWGNYLSTYIIQINNSKGHFDKYLEVHKLFSLVEMWHTGYCN